MSNIDDDLDDLDDDTSDGDGNAPKALRDQVKKLNKKLADLESQNTDLAGKLRSRDLADILDKHGAPKRLAKYASRDIEDVSEDTVLNWLTENGEDFGWEPAGDDADSDDAAVEQAQRVSRASAEANPVKPETASELLQLLRTGDAKTLMEKGLLAPPQ